MRFWGRVHVGIGLAAVLIAAMGVAVVASAPQASVSRSSRGGHLLGPTAPVSSIAQVGAAGGASTAASTPQASSASGPAGAPDEGATTGLVPPLLGGKEPAPESAPAPSPPAVPSGYDVVWPAGVGFGQYRAFVDVQVSEPTRVDVTVGGDMVASYGLGTTTRTLQALVHIDGPPTQLGVRSSVPITVGAVRLDRVAPTFTTRGTSIIDPNGRPWLFRGTNRNGYQLTPDGTPAFNRFAHEGEAMWQWGFNAVRLPLNQEFWLADCPVQNSWAHSTPQRPDGSLWRYRELIDEEVRHFTDRGILVLIDLHVSSRGEALGCDADGSTLRELPDGRSAAFWRSVAARYRSQPYVAFDLYNEPHLHDAQKPPSEEDAKSIWRNGGSVPYRDQSGLLSTNASYDAVGMQQLYTEVRATGATNLVFVAGLYYAHRPEVMLDRSLDATALVASVHMYCLGCGDIPSKEQVQYLGGDHAGAPDPRGVADRFPTVVTEFGTDEWWDTSDNARYLDYFEPRRIGWSVWDWAGGGNGVGQSPYGILADPTSSTAARVPGTSGRPIWDGLAPERAARGY